MNNFELRQYDPITGRWMTTDPFGQYHSPYLGMGNDPVNTIDPSGGICGSLLGFTIAGFTMNFSSVVIRASAPIDPPKPNPWSTTKFGPEIYSGPPANNSSKSTSSTASIPAALSVGATMQKIIQTAFAELGAFAIILSIPGDTPLGAKKVFSGAGEGNENYPGPLNYTYEPPSQSPLNNPQSGFDPENPPPGWTGVINWTIRGAFAYKLYDEYNTYMKSLGSLPAQRDNTIVVPVLRPYRP